MERQQITIIIETDADPSQLLDLAIEMGNRLADDVDGTFDESTACVQGVN